MNSTDSSIDNLRRRVHRQSGTPRDFGIFGLPLRLARTSLLALPTLLALLPLSAQAYFEVKAACPAQADAASVPSIDVELTSLTSLPIEVHLSAGYVAEGNSTLFGKTFIGPDTAAARQFLSGFEHRILPLATPPVLPATPIGRVVEFFVVARAEEVGGAIAVQMDACLIELPEPTWTTGLAFGVLGLGFTRGASRRTQRFSRS